MKYFESLTLVSAAFVAVGAVSTAALGGRGATHACDAEEEDCDDPDRHDQREKTLYVWTGDQARVESDFLTVINFNDRSRNYGKILRTVPVPTAGNEPHHCHASTDGKVLACGGLLSLLRNQDSIFLFDISRPRHPRFWKSIRAQQSSITDDFLPLPGGGFLVTQMGSAAGGAPGRVAVLDPGYELVAELPAVPPTDGFNPHGISADPARGLLVTSDFINPVTTLNLWPGPVELRGALRFWSLDSLTITRTVAIPGDQGGTMDVKLIPGDPHGRAITASMFSGFVYTVDPTDGSVVQSFDCEDIVPHVPTPVQGGMTQLLAQPARWRDRLLFGSFQAGQVGMLDTSDVTSFHGFKQVDVVDLGLGAGPHDIDLTDDDSRLVVTDYFLDEDDFGKVHFEGDHKIHVIKVYRDHLELDPRFEVDMNTAFATPKRPHGIEMK